MHSPSIFSWRIEIWEGVLQMSVMVDLTMYSISFYHVRVQFL